MPQNGYALYTLTGPRSAGRTTLAQLVAKKHESLLPELLPGWTFEFLGNPLGHLPLPPIREQRTCTQYARARLLMHWSQIYHHIIEHYLPIAERRRNGECIIAFTDGLGLDALIDATAYSINADGWRKATLLHHRLVQDLLVVENIAPPLYFLLQAAPERVDAWMLQKHPSLAEVPRKKRLEFICHQERVIDEYFNPGTHQRAYKLDAERYSLDELADHVVDCVYDFSRGLSRLSA